MILQKQIIYTIEKFALNNERIISIIWKVRIARQNYKLVNIMASFSLIYNDRMYPRRDNVLFNISLIKINKIMVFIIPYVNKATARIIERCRQRKQIRGAVVLAAGEKRGGSRDISLPRFVSAREAGRGEVFQLNADYIALSRY